MFHPLAMATIPVAGTGDPPIRNGYHPSCQDWCPFVLRSELRYDGMVPNESFWLGNELDVSLIRISYPIQSALCEHIIDPAVLGSRAERCLQHKRLTRNHAEQWHG